MRKKENIHKVVPPSNVETSQLLTANIVQESEEKEEEEKDEEEDEEKQEQDSFLTNARIVVSNFRRRN